AILLNMPGTAANAAAALDGYPLAKKGEAVFALNVSAMTSTIGALFSVCVLFILIPILSPVLLHIGPQEIFWVATFGLITMLFAITKDYLKGLVSLGVGIALTQIGLGGPGLPAPRFTFGSNYLIEGVDVIVVVLGFLVVSEVLQNLITDNSISTEKKTKLESVGNIPTKKIKNKEQMINGWLAPFKNFWLTLRSSVIGLFVGIIPGVGGSVAQFISYNAAVAYSSDKSKFGQGAVEGLVASEAAVNAKDGGQLFPTLLFGIPGSAEMAIVLAAWQVHGLNPGPFFLRDHGVLAWALIIGLLLANLLSAIFVILISSFISKVRTLNISVVSCVVFSFTIVAVFIIRQNILDVISVVLFGFIAMFMRRYGYSAIGVVIGFVLGSVVEDNWNLTLQAGRGDLYGFVSTPGSLVIAVLSAITVAAIIYTFIRKNFLGVKKNGK